MDQNARQRIVTLIWYLIDNLKNLTLNLTSWKWFGSSLKWTVLDQSGRSMGVKLDGPNYWKWTFMYQTRRSERLKVNALRKWRNLESESEWSKELVLLRGQGESGVHLVDGPGGKWTVQLGESGRSKASKVDGPQRMKLDGTQSAWVVKRGWKWTVHIKWTWMVVKSAWVVKNGW